MNHARRERLSRPHRTASEDRETLRLMMAVIRDSLSAALIRCSGLARNLENIDPNQASLGLRSLFDPDARGAAIQDLFSDAFGSIWSSRNNGSEVYGLWEKDELPSGVKGGKQ